VAENLCGLGRMRGFFLAPVALYAVAAFVALYAVILSPGTIGLSHDWSIPPYPPQLAQWSNSFQWILLENAFGVENQWEYYWINHLIFGLLASAGLGGEQVSKGLVLVSLIVSGCSMYFLCRSIKLNVFPSFISGFFYMFTPVIFNRVAAGHIYYMISYAFSPFAISFFIMTLNAKDKRSWLGYAMVSGILYFLSAAQIQVIGLIFLAIATYALVTIRSFKDVLKHMLTLLFVTVICVLLNPLLLTRMMQLEAILSQVSVGYLFTRLRLLILSQITNPLKSFTLTGWVTDAFSMACSNSLGLWYDAMLILAVMAFSTLYLAWCMKELRRHIVCWWILAAAVIFLTSGTSPATALWLWLYEYARPVATMYGGLYHIMVVAAMAYAVLIGIFMNHVFSRILDRKQLSSLWKTLNVFRGIIKCEGASRTSTYATLMVLLLMVSYAYPSLTMYPDVLQTYVWDNSYETVYNDLAQEKGLFRVLWLPTVAYGISYQGLKYGGVDPMIWFSPKPSFPQVLGGAAMQPYANGHAAYTGFIVGTISPYGFQDRTKYLGYLLSFSGMKYVLLRSDAFTYALPADQYNTSRNILGNQKDIKHLRTVGNITIYENENYLPIVYPVMPRESSLIVGGLNSLVSLSYLTNEAKVLPKQKLFVVSSQLKPEEVKDAVQYLRNIVISPNELYDLAFASIPSSYKLYPNQFTNQDPSKTWYSTNAWEWNLVGEVNRPAIAYVPGSILNMSYYAEASGSYELWAKILFSSNSQSLIFSVDGEQHNKIVTRSLGFPERSLGGEAFRWIKLGRVQLERGFHQLSFMREEPGTKDYGYYREAVALLVAAPPNVVDKAFNKSESLLADRDVVTILELEKPVEAEHGWAPVMIGSDASQGLALNSTGDLGFAKYRVFIPHDGDYKVYLRVLARSRTDLHIGLASESSMKPKEHTLPLSPTSSFVWREFTEKLQKGWHSINISSTRANTMIDIMALESSSPEKGDVVEGEVKFEAVKVNPTLYQVSVNSTSPLFLVFSMNYNNFWKATTREGAELHPIVANAYAQAFYLNQTGSHTIILNYTNQKNYEKAWSITIASLVLFIIAVCLYYSKVKAKKKN